MGNPEPRVHVQFQLYLLDDCHMRENFDCGLEGLESWAGWY